MELARYKAEDGRWRSVWASEYDPGIHGSNLRCGDTRCEAEVRFKAAHASHGSTKVPAHFFSLDREAHIGACSCLTMAGTPHEGRLSISHAIEQHQPVIMNFNFYVGDPRFGHMGPAVALDRLPTRYNKFRHTHPHASVSIRSLSDYFQERARIERKSLDTNLQVAHCQDMRPHANFLISDSREKRIRLFESMAKNVTSVRTQPVYDFPRLITFAPATSKLRSLPDAATTGTQLLSAPLVLESLGSGAMLLVDALRFATPDLRETFLKHNRQDVVARPMLLPANLQQARTQMHRGRTGFVCLFWQVDSKAQFQPAPGAQSMAIGRQEHFAFDR